LWQKAINSIKKSKKAANISFLFKVAKVEKDVVFSKLIN
jgi:hypothetical protein